MSRRIAASLLVLACALAAAAPASAAPRTKSAAAFADAGLKGRAAVQAQTGEIERQTEALQPKLCLEVVEDVAEAKRSMTRTIPFMLLGLVQPMMDALVPASRQMVVDLDAVPTKDPALVAGREAWRRVVASFESYPRVDRPCERLREWRDSGWAVEKRPPSLAREIAAMARGSRSIDRGLARAQRRLRQLGVSRAAAKRFTGEDWAGGLDSPLDDAATTEEHSTVAPRAAR
jgi:hypothetical protein